jgi:dihydrofolate reductase
VARSQWRAGKQVEHHAQVRRVLDTRRRALAQLDGSGGDVVGEVSKLKQQLDGEILVAASFRLVHTLLEHDLVDELRLKIFPVVLGAGERLFAETSNTKALRLVLSRIVDDGVAYLTFAVVREAGSRSVAREKQLRVQQQ